MKSELGFCRNLFNCGKFHTCLCLMLDATFCLLACVILFILPSVNDAQYTAYRFAVAQEVRQTCSYKVWLFVLHCCTANVVLFCVCAILTVLCLCCLFAEAGDRLQWADQKGDVSEEMHWGQHRELAASTTRTGCKSLDKNWACVPWENVRVNWLASRRDHSCFKDERSDLPCRYHWGAR